MIGMPGIFSRKGVCHRRDGVLAELADVISTAAVAMGGIAGDVEQAAVILERRLALLPSWPGSDAN